MFYSNCMGFFKNVFYFVRSPSHSRTTAVIVLFLIFSAIPLTVIISQQQQQLRQRAAEAEVCSRANSMPICDFNFQTNPCSLGDQCVDFNNVVFECQQE